MWGRVTVATPPAVLPLTPAQLRERLRVDASGDADHDAAEDALLSDFLRAALAEIDGPKGRGLAVMAQTWTLALPAFRPEIVLPGWPVRAVSAVRYLDATGTAQALDPAEWRLLTSLDPARLRPAVGGAWPVTARDPQAVEIDYTLGAEDAAEADPGLVTAAAMLAGHYYENREAVSVGPEGREMPLGPASILARYARGAAG